MRGEGGSDGESEREVKKMKNLGSSFDEIFCDAEMAIHTRNVKSCPIPNVSFLRT